VELAGLLARNARKELARVYENASRALTVAVGMLSGATVVVAPLVMMLWTRGKVVYDADLMLLLVGTTVVCAPAQVAVTFLWYGRVLVSSTRPLPFQPSSRWVLQFCWLRGSRRAVSPQG
jgi:hypothetical protein